MRVTSFDIFDTTLIRRCGTPSAIFEQLAKELYPDDAVTSEAFLLWRTQAGAKADILNQGKEVSLTDIYATLNTESFKEYTHQELMDVERKMEARNLVAHPSVKKLIKEKRKTGWQIVFISDMYLDSPFLKEVLIREGCAEPSDPIYVSCEANSRKDTGQLYKIVREELKPTEWEHYGDNRHSDVMQARKQGIKAFAVDTSYTPAEKYMLDAGNAFPRRCGWHLLPSISRTARILSENSPFDKMAADFVAPAYIPYVIDVLRTAKQMGMRRLYFLSRDSYILMRIAEIFASDNNDLELRYLFVSRRSLLLPYLVDGDKQDYLAIADHHTIVRQGTVDSRLAALGTDRKEMQDSFGIEFPYKRINNKEEEKDFLQKIFHSTYTPILQQRAHEQYALLLEYLKQEMVIGDELCGLVDVGWLGTTRLMINHILRKESHQDVHFFYFGIRGDVLPPSAGHYSTYYRCDELSTEATGLIENYYSASPYPTTIGYKNKENHVIPLFPDCKKYEETAITKANVKMSIAMAQTIKESDDYCPEMLFTWSKTSLKILTETNVNVDLTPLATCSKFDAEPFVKQLGMRDLFHLILFGKHTTAFDKASLKLSMPQMFWKPAWRIHQFTKKKRRYIYQKMIFVK